MRYEGLISIAYDDIATSATTQTVRDVLNYSTGLDEQAERITTGAIERFLTPYAIRENVNAEMLAGFPTVNLTDQRFGMALVDEDFPIFLRLRILPGEIGEYTIRLNADNVQFDPLLSVVAYDGDAARTGVFASCTTLFRDDDSGGGGNGLNSMITETLDAGYYLIGLGTLAESGLGEVLVTRTQAQ